MLITHFCLSISLIGTNCAILNLNMQFSIAVFESNGGDFGREVACGVDKTMTYGLWSVEWKKEEYPKDWILNCRQNEIYLWLKGDISTKMLLKSIKESYKKGGKT